MAADIATAGISEEERQLAFAMQKAVLITQDTNEVAALLKRGADINGPIGCGTFSAVDGAVGNGNLDMLKFLLSQGAKPLGRALVAAAFYSKSERAFEMSKALLQAGADVNAKDRYNSALTSAGYRGNRRLVELLLNQPGINVNERSESGYTALMYAAQHGWVDITDKLLKAGAKVDIKNDRGETATTIARQRVTAQQALLAKLEAQER